MREYIHLDECVLRDDLMDAKCRFCGEVCIELCLAFYGEFLGYVVCEKCSLETPALQIEEVK